MTNSALKKSDLRKSNAEYKDLLDRLQDIPTLPIIAMKVNQLIQDPNSSGADIAEVLKKDQVMTAKILRLANSSYYAIPGGVTDVQRALAFLGFNTISQLVLGLSVFSLFSNLGVEEFTMLDFWKHALGTAVASDLIARHCLKKKLIAAIKPEEAFTCGLLHDIGKLVMHEIDKERLVAVVTEARKRESGFVDVEREHDLPGHAFMGEMIATRWGLPQVIRLAIRYHHQDVSRMDSILSSAKPLIQVVRLANTLCVKNKIGSSGDYSKGEVTPDLLIHLKLGQADLDQIEKDLEEGMEKAGAFLSVVQ